MTYQVPMNTYNVQISEEDGLEFPPLPFVADTEKAAVLAAAKRWYGEDCLLRHRWDDVYQAMYGRKDEGSIAVFQYMKFIKVTVEKQ